MFYFLQSKYTAFLVSRKFQRKKWKNFWTVEWTDMEERALASELKDLEMSLGLVLLKQGSKCINLSSLKYFTGLHESGSDYVAHLTRMFKRC